VVKFFNFFVVLYKNIKYPKDITVKIIPIFTDKNNVVTIDNIVKIIIIVVTLNCSIVFVLFFSKISFEFIS
jgi:hypothetical protein